MRILMNLSYNGRDFFGFQHQNGKRTVQGEIERILSEMHREFVRIHPASRTDRGVHAMDQYIHFDTDLDIEPERWAYILNSRLDDDVYFKWSKEVSDDFHVRYNKSQKTYRYRMYCGERDPFAVGLKTHVEKDIDIELMREAAKDFVGVHDFTSFSSAKGVIENKVREIYRCDVEVLGDDVDVVICGSGFLYNMVRIIVAYLLQVAAGERANETLSIIEAKDRALVPRTAPSDGLYLERIEYLD